MRTRNAQTQARIDSVIHKLKKEEEDLETLITMVENAAAFSQKTTLPQWMVTDLFEKAEELKKSRRSKSK